MPPSGQYPAPQAMLGTINWWRNSTMPRRSTTGRAERATGAAKYWKKTSSTATRAFRRRAPEGRVLWSAGSMPPGSHSYAPPASAYAQPMQEYDRRRVPPTRSLMGRPATLRPDILRLAIRRILRSIRSLTRRSRSDGLDERSEFVARPIVRTGGAAPAGAPCQLSAGGISEPAAGSRTRHLESGQMGSMGGLGSLLGPLLGGRIDSVTRSAC